MGLSNGDDAADGSQAAPYKTIAQALKTAPACATIYLQGDGTTAAVTIPAGTTLELSGDATLTGTGSGTAITLASGATLKAGAYTLTVSKYATALTVSQGATVADGHYDLANKLTLAASVQGTSRDVLRLKVTGKYDAQATGRRPQPRSPRTSRSTPAGPRPWVWTRCRCTTSTSRAT